MNIVLTGITGNLGHEVEYACADRGIGVIPIVRPSRKDAVASYSRPFEDIITGDLLEPGSIEYHGKADCIVHCAGMVHFRDAGTQNEQMMHTVIELAQRLDVPVYFVSTAFVYHPEGSVFRNSYEQDKAAAEEALRRSGLVYTILRPSVLTGNTRTGELLRYTGYYQIVAAFLSAVQVAQANGRRLRFPHMAGLSDVVPVDQAARRIVEAIEGERSEILYVTNPEPVSAAWMLASTLRILGLDDVVEILDIPFIDLIALDPTPEETTLLKFAENFSPYWSMTQRFPQSACTENLVDEAYLAKTLSAFARTLHA